ncbi:hypothetical protein G9U51_10550 [Calidifontibacter sp. DB0510]|uniref:Uncharacterized protein n=1 Tax=Metallococcus carri TaxID=1656884 RepID=A0A967B1D5_9MICO|nr:DUF6049 family protein [Metallococcus carri]NHN56214.1 hypothetical protein [Metallococcus carri]NOP38735.1 hypothetical protein [Calidifontibacter sp. DB2511S]
MSRLRRATAVWVALLTLLGLVGFAPPVYADAPTVALHLDPAGELASKNSPTTVGGTVTNTTGGPLDQVVVHVALGGSLLDTPYGVSSWSDGSRRMAQQEVATTTVGNLAPGQTVRFTATIAADKLGYSYTYASLPMTITVTEGSAVTSTSTLQSTRTTLEWGTQSATTPIGTTVIVPLTLPADPALFGPAGAARTAAWTKAIGPNSAIARTVAAFQGDPVTFVVDPSIVDPPVAADPDLPPLSTPTQGEPPTATAAPSSSTSPSATSTPTSTPTQTPSPTSTASGTDSPTSSGPTSSSSSSTTTPTTTDPVTALADTLLRQLQDSRVPVWWTPYGDPDLTGLGSLRANQILQRMLGRGLPQRLAQVSTTTVAWPAADQSASATGAMLRLWQAARGSAASLLLPTRAVDASGVLGTDVRRLTGTAGVLLYDDRLSSLLADASVDPGVRVRRLQAELLALYQQRPGDTRSAALVVPRTAISDPQSLSAVVAAIRTAPWLSTATATQSLTAQAKAPAARLLSTPAAPSIPAPPPVPVGRDDLRQLAEFRRRLDAVTSIAVDSSGIAADRGRALDEIGSVRWRGNATGLRQVLSADGTALANILAKVTVNPSSVNLLADSGKLSVTVVNGLSRPVHDLRLTLQPRKYLLRIPEQPTLPAQVGATSRTSVRTTVVAVAPGEVLVDAVLTTPDGTLLGPDPTSPTQLSINVRPPSSWIYVVLGIVAGLVLLVGTLRSIRRGRPTSPVTPGGPLATPAEAVIDADPQRAPTDDLTPRPPDEE